MLKIEEGEKMVLEGKAEIQEANHKVSDCITSILRDAVAAAKNVTSKATDQVRM